MTTTETALSDAATRRASARRDLAVMAVLATLVVIALCSWVFVNAGMSAALGAAGIAVAALAVVVLVTVATVGVIAALERRGKRVLASRRAA